MIIQKRYGLRIGQLKSSKEDNKISLLETYKTSKILLKIANRNKKIPISPTPSIKRSYLSNYKKLK